MAEGEDMIKEGQIGPQFNIGTPPEYVAKFRENAPRMQQGFDPNQGMENNPVDQTSKQDRSELERQIAERMIASDYRSAMTVIGSDLIKEIQDSVEAGNYDRLEKSIMKALPLAEGLEFGVYAQSYGVPESPPDTSNMSEEELKEAQVKENNVYSKLRNMFMTVEDSIDRGNVGYLRDSILDSLSRPLRELEEWEKDGGATWEKSLRDKLTDSYNRENFNRLIKGDDVVTEAEINGRIDRAVKFQRGMQERKVTQIKENREDMLSLDLHVKSRFTFDNAFRQRQYVVHDRELQSNMKRAVGLGTAEPDGTHFQGFYQVDKDWGDAVDQVERQLVELGQEGYFNGNLSTKDFKVWMDRLLEKSKVKGNGKNRMDVVWAAWKMFSFKEMPGKFAMQTKHLANEKNPNSGHRISFNANPPYVGDLSTWLSNPEEHRANEYGWNVEMLNANRTGNWNGQVIGERTKSYKAISHSGHPIGISHLTEMDAPSDVDPNPIARFGKHKLGNFMEFATLSRDEDEVEKRFRGRNLWQVWQEDELKVKDENGNTVTKLGMSQADPDFPWADTDFGRVRGQSSNEVPSGPVGYWFLQRGRAFTVLQENLGVPELRGFNSVAYLSKLRNWDKLGMIKPGKFTGNPIFAKLYSDIMFFKGISYEASHNYTKNGFVSELEFTTFDPSEFLIKADPATDYKGVNLTSIIYHARQENLIDDNEMKRLLQIKPRQLTP